MGAAKGTYKVVQVFFTLVNFPKHQRSQVDRLQLGMVFKEKLLKKYSYDVIFHKMVEDMKKLEEGIIINNPEPKKVKFGLCIYVADNLEAHLMGGFSSCFSSKSVCRHCHIQYEQLDENIHDYDGDKAHDKWTVNEYDSIIANIGVDQEETSMSVSGNEVMLAGDIFPPNSDFENSVEDEEFSDSDDAADDGHGEEHIDNRGVKSKCPLNVLQSFHCVQGFPPDLLHDLFEGVVPEDLLGIIRLLSLKDWFTIEEYNRCLRRMGWTSYETTDKPLDVPINMKATKLKGKAVSHWVHIRNFPLIIDSFVTDKSDPVLALGLKLHEVTERITATEYYQYEIHLLKEAVLEYLDMRKEIRLENPRFLSRPKPKHHFISHYCDFIKVFGPPITYWTARFESKHRIAKVLSL